MNLSFEENINRWIETWSAAQKVEPSREQFLRRKREWMARWRADHRSEWLAKNRQYVRAYRERIAAAAIINQTTQRKDQLHATL